MTPRVVVLSAPSGGGKTTMSRALLARRSDIGYSVSATTREPRQGEKNGEAYYFLTPEEFRKRQTNGDFLETAEYAGERYGTLKSEVERVLGLGKHVILDIEVHGAIQVRRQFPRPRSVSVFILPPSAEVLVQRLRQRQSESGETLQLRLEKAREELRQAQQDVAGAVLYDYWIVNDDLEKAVREISEIIDAPEQGGHRADQRIIGGILRGLAAELGRLKQTT